LTRELLAESRIAETGKSSPLRADKLLQDVKAASEVKVEQQQPEVVVRSCSRIEDDPQPQAMAASRFLMDDDDYIGELKHLPFPPEIRQRIYKYALQLPGCFKEPEYRYATPKPRSRTLWPVMVKQRSFHYPIATGAPSPFDLSLLLVSKQTFLEAYHVFYRFNPIFFTSTDALLEFLQGIGYARRQELTDIGFDWVGDEAKAAFRLLKTCGNLRAST
jgi:hypothetical protein